MKTLYLKYEYCKFEVRAVYLGNSYRTQNTQLKTHSSVRDVARSEDTSCRICDYDNIILYYYNVISPISVFTSRIQSFVFWSSVGFRTISGNNVVFARRY